MADLGVNRLYDVALGFAMLIGRYAAMAPTLALAGAFAAKPRNDATPGTLRTDSVLFVCLVIANVVVVGALTFLPTDALGPIVEQLLVSHGATFSLTSERIIRTAGAAVPSSLLPFEANQMRSLF